MQTATLANGCFWCTEAVFKRLKGVSSVIPGYSGGTTKNPSYEQVSTGTTGHAEAIQIKFDPKIISYPQILEVFFKTHNPTTKNRQGMDIGNQYRSAIFHHSPEQKQAATAAIKKFQPDFKNSIVTQINKFTAFYAAEDYHHNYYAKNKNAAYCRLIIDPKIKKLYKDFKNLTKNER